MLNIGSVFYRKGEKTGTLEATWCHIEDGEGTGFATGGSDGEFAGTYTIKYFDKNGKELIQRELVIEKTETYYELTWLNNGEVTARGVGVETTDGLSVGWMNIP
jgi:hypothetical protein